MELILCLLIRCIQALRSVLALISLSLSDESLPNGFTQPHSIYWVKFDNELEQKVGLVMDPALRYHGQHRVCEI